MVSAKHFFTFLTMVYLLTGALAPALAQQAPPAQGDEAQLITVLESEAPLVDKAKACQRLGMIGTKRAVPALAKLLADDQLSHYARYGLKPITDPAVDETLRQAMGTLQGELLVGVINSIGMRHDVKATDSLEELPALVDRFAQPKTPNVASAAHDALRKACLRMPDRDACAAVFLGRMDTSPTAEKVGLLGLLGVVGGPKALELAERDNEKKLVLEVLAQYSSAQSLSIVTPYLDDAALKETASSTAVSIADRIVDAHPTAVAAALKKATQATSNTELANSAKALLQEAEKKSGQK